MLSLSWGGIVAHQDTRGRNGYALPRIGERRNTGCMVISLRIKQDALIVTNVPGGQRIVQMAVGSGGMRNAIMLCGPSGF